MQAMLAVVGILTVEFQGKGPWWTAPAAVSRPNPLSATAIHTPKQKRSTLDCDQCSLFEGEHRAMSVQLHAETKSLNASHN
jgi:hypothetical protein